MGVPDAFPNIVKIVKNFTRVKDSRLLPNVPIFGRKLPMGKRREKAEHQSLTMRNKLPISKSSISIVKKNSFEQIFSKKLCPNQECFQKLQLWPNQIHFEGCVDDVKEEERTGTNTWVAY